MENIATQHSHILEMNAIYKHFKPPHYPFISDMQKQITWIWVSFHSGQMQNNTLILSSVLLRGKVRTGYIDQQLYPPVYPSCVFSDADHNPHIMSLSQL